ncbi:hypothetical protein [Desulfoluna spongiiphila]|uniref:Uncharacterized protein n=1 Tax=Desulfoluna spongiiphila TaxID=419481 RepID=A0A1G5HN07_9BACT|nr:hypothetical protein [Desulfoluna spongiiphila]SCY65166.1 hypothetical protein SAMN05216233_1157 [Desulfoluna spongiiphila]VVS95668.1 consensus disorder prediction [Desulfoluna spongiiphila]
MLNPFSTNHDIEREETDFSVTNSESKSRGFALLDKDMSGQTEGRHRTCFVRAPFSLLFKGAECTCSSRGAVAIHHPERGDDPGFKPEETPEAAGDQGQHLRFQAVFNSRSSLWST